MPYPHKNSDGKATLGHDEKGMPKPLAIPDYWHPAYGPKNFAHIIDEDLAKIKKQMAEISSKAIGKKLDELLPKPGELGKPEGKYVTFNIIKGPPQPDPVLIPATEKYSNLWAKPFNGEPPKAIPIKSLDMDVRIDVPGVISKKVIGLRMAINTHHDYHESEIRQMLELNFRQITDKIIEEMKEGKK